MKNLILTLTLLLAATAPASAQLFHTRSHKNLTLGPNQHYEVAMQTSQGLVVMKLHNETPKHRDNFVKLAQSEFYNGILFHRVIEGFMIQAGDPSSKEASEVRTYGDGSVGYTIDAEIRPEFFHKKGTLAAARESDDVNPARKSNGSQFYIVTGKILTDSLKNVTYEKIKHLRSWEISPEREIVYRKIGGAPHLDGVYTIFGEVIRGQEVVDKINAMPTYKNDRPKRDVYIKTMIVKVVNDRKKR